MHAVDGTVTGVDVVDSATGETYRLEADYVFSSMPVRELIDAIEINDGATPVPSNVTDVAAGLLYRDFITVGRLLERLLITNQDPDRGLISDNWIYIQEKDVKVGRLQIISTGAPPRRQTR